MATAAASHTSLMSRTRSPRRRLALAALLAAVGLAVASFPFRATWWGGWVLAVAEAGIVGGLADWFAGTALFRHPLGLPIPHTALIPANWELMAERVGVMVGNRVLTKEYVTREVSRFDVADLLARLAARVKPGDVQDAVHAVARWAAEQLSPAAAADLAGVRRGGERGPPGEAPASHSGRDRPGARMGSADHRARGRHAHGGARPARFSRCRGRPCRRGAGELPGEDGYLP